jgi:hypothetical protein
VSCDGEPCLACADRETQRCVRFLSGEEPTLDAFLACYGSGNDGPDHDEPLDAPTTAIQARQEIVDEAVADGRVAAGERDEWVRLCEAYPLRATNLLETLAPDALTAGRNHFADDDADAAYRRDFATTFGEEPVV